MQLTIPAKAVVMQHNTDGDAHDHLERRTAHVTDTSSTSVVVTLDSNTIYTYTQALASLSLTVPAGFLYAGVNFISGSTATTFATPSTWIFNGDDCTPSRVFVPTPNSSYRMAVESVGATVVCDVQKYS